MCMHVSEWCGMIVLDCIVCTSVSGYCHLANNLPHKSRERDYAEGRGGMWVIHVELVSANLQQ